jgi:hypothetical protein
MTHARTPGSIEAALMETLRDLSEAEVQRAIPGRTLKSFYRAANPQIDIGLRIEHAAALDAALVAKGKPARLLPLALQLHGLRLAELGGAPAHDPRPPLERLAETMIEVGDIASALRAACGADSPGGAMVTEDEAGAILREVAEARQRLDTLARDVEATTRRRPRAVA